MNIEKIVIGVDLDDVLTDLNSAWLEWLNNKHGLSLNSKDMVNWEMTDNIPMLTKEQIFEPLYLPEFWDSVKPDVEAQYFMRKLCTDDRFTVYICTNTHYKTLKPKIEKCLFPYYPFLTWKNIITTTNKQLLNFDILIDDCVNNLIGGKYVGILRTKPWNKNINHLKLCIYRADNWNGIYRKIGKICGLKDLYE